MASHVSIRERIPSCIRYLMESALCQACSSRAVPWGYWDIFLSPSSVAGFQSNPDLLLFSFSDGILVRLSSPIPESILSAGPTCHVCIYVSLTLHRCPWSRISRFSLPYPVQYPCSPRPRLKHFPSLLLLLYTHPELYTLHNCRISTLFSLLRISPLPN